MTRHEPICSFCQKTQKEVAKLIKSGEPNTVYICNECIETCNQIIEGVDEKQAEANQENLKIPKPKEIHNYLDEYIIGQENAKRILSVAVYNHYKRISLIDGKTSSGVKVAKSNILLAGPTGCGKTYIVETLAKFLNVPFVTADATSLTEAGYVGDDVESILAKLIQASGGDIKKAEKGIVYIDEIDKIARKGENMSITRDVSGEGVQQGLLKILEGSNVSVPPGGGRKHPQQDLLIINTSNILFIVGGAFVGLDEQMNKKFAKKLGLTPIKIEEPKTQNEPSFKIIPPNELIKFGLIPEFIGRLPVSTFLEKLDEDALCRILTEPKNALIRQYQEILKLDGVELIFEQDALKEIAKKAIENNTGARGLRTIVEQILLELMYVIPSEKDVAKCIVTKDVILNNAQITVVKKYGKIA